MSVRTELDAFGCEEFSAFVHIHHDKTDNRKWAVLILRDEKAEIDLYLNSVEGLEQLINKIQEALMVATYKTEEKAE